MTKLTTLPPGMHILVPDCFDLPSLLKLGDGIDTQDGYFNHSGRYL